MFRISTYLEFRKRNEAEGSPEKKWVVPTKEAVQSLNKEHLLTLLNCLHAIATRIAWETGGPSLLPMQPENIQPSLSD